MSRTCPRCRGKGTVDGPPLGPSDVVRTFVESKGGEAFETREVLAALPSIRRRQVYNSLEWLIRRGELQRIGRARFARAS